MSRYLCKVTEQWRVESEAEADMLIEEARNSNMFELSKSSVAKKEVKSKGEIVDEYLLVDLTKMVQSHKEPTVNVGLEYVIPTAF